MTTHADLQLTTPEEHPFAVFVRILGKGKRGARSLTRDEARQAMGMLLDGEAEAAQLGAFLMLLRHKEESPEELAGFTEAVRARLPNLGLGADIDWPSYAGKKRHLPWYLLAAKCLAASGLRIFMHGGGAHTAGRLYTEQLLEPLGIPVCRNWGSVAQALDTQHLAFMPLAAWAPALQQMIDLRNTLGLRSPIHSLARVLNPLGARLGLQSIFHPGYQAVHREASRLLGDTAIVIKGDGGEIEVNPDSPCHLYGTAGGQNWDEEWPAQAAQRHVKPASLEVPALLAVWQGQAQDSYGEKAVLGTMALALRGLGEPAEQAFNHAQTLWAQRER
ncbi:MULTISPECIES: glycosyl transferase family protein [unclassified Pseudomonas]|uniref:glycosyl transferase family protein n=1 Tax=unclassified Pseudomonas TaxID=196821 RepID=UPI000BC9B3AD|nr:MULTISPECIES: glycosyl transferase family protein [unclassified Pseudomonas]PVZ19809.1 anthranilate phosphoribosyltransferase [Pseudomonas sp. URIL14HWK12:I12]PVZ26875.1 anthranilate phosphoribosyltransferase [Pseudomonas sp. URIL14HWK12:I10]PVZ37764.1 anthranilate phosphoribosyltransferase [Pseudomonas sp. URIL14HWK12:I11]SNZ05762.1 Anthranilate phosphoribosyltransferase [Pseudomonas sp. URIL14HWK12:I9]